jgi:hypothetical protein
VDEADQQLGQASMKARGQVDWIALDPVPEDSLAVLVAVLVKGRVSTTAKVMIETVQIEL